MYIELKAPNVLFQVNTEVAIYTTCKEHSCTSIIDSLSQATKASEQFNSRDIHAEQQQIENEK